MRIGGYDDLRLYLGFIDRAIAHAEKDGDIAEVNRLIRKKAKYEEDFHAVFKIVIEHGG